MHTLQKRLLESMSIHNLDRLTLREIGDLVGEIHPQKIKHHLQQLEQKGLIQVDRANKIIKRVERGSSLTSKLVTLPILGSVDCGPVTIYADENIQGYLKVSDRLVKRKPGLFALKAIGSSMNRASVAGKTIEDGDYVVIDSEDRVPRNGDYVLSIVDGLCNVKKFIFDEDNQQIILMSESSHDYAPIIIHPQESEYFVNGKVVQVIKKPSIS